ncbi:MAG: serine/threonine protein kinase [Myxococcales bacterium]|nr:serine/threonine protein kinase [Myxococcales bacterium]
MSAATTLPAVGGAPLGGYELLCELASGGMATVYVARPGPGVPGAAAGHALVALKCLHPHLWRKPGFVEMFLDEARLSAQIRHPSVVSALDVGGDREEGYFLAMPYVEGADLGTLQRSARSRGQRMTPPVVVRIVLDTLAGLQAAHGLRDRQGLPLGLVHRDVSPHNLMIGVDGITRLTDFGVAKARGRLAETEAGMIKGKLSYMAPEQASGKEVDHRSDLFAMGIVLWEALARQRLFYREDPSDCFRRLLFAPIPRLGDLESRLTPFDAVIAKALAREPGQRFGSAAEFARALERAAVRAGGVADRASVARVVEALAAEKLSHERDVLRHYDLGGAPERAPAAASGGPLSPASMHSGSRLRPYTAPPMAPDSHDPCERSTTRRRRRPKLPKQRRLSRLALLAILATAGALWAASQSPGSEAAPSAEAAPE